jgi:hypothetical protein
MFNVTKLPELKFFCQEVNLPDLTAPAAEYGTPMVSVPVPGDKLSFGELSVTFMVDEDMSNFIAVHNWMIGLGFPESHEQYANFIGSQSDDISYTPALSGYSDGILQILNSSNTAIRSINFVDLFPTSLSQLTMQSTTSETSYIMAQASFRYTYYKFI